MSDKDIIDQVGKIAEKIIFRRRKGNLYILIGIVAILVASTVYFGPSVKAFLAGVEEEPPIAVINEMTDEEKAELLKNKAIEIKRNVLGEARGRKELLVLEHDIQIESEWQSALGGLDIFKKTKRIVSYGTGYYNIDLSGLDENSINVDNDRKLVTITVPRAVLKSISVDEGKTEYEDTQRDGMFGFGELKLTAEQQGLFKQSVEEQMRVELEKPEMLEQADVAGKKAITDIYKSVVTSVSDEYSVEVTIGN